jgi:hypothetical protein
MMKKDILATSLGLEPLPPKQYAEIDDTDHSADDYEFARKNIKEIIEKGNKALEDIADIAHQSESARAYEVTTNLIKTLVDANKDLLDLAKKKKDLSQKSDSAGDKTVNNNLFVGSSSELLKMIKGENS